MTIESTSNTSLTSQAARQVPLYSKEGLTTRGTNTIYCNGKELIRYRVNAGGYDVNERAEKVCARIIEFIRAGKIKSIDDLKIDASNNRFDVCTVGREVLFTVTQSDADAADTTRTALVNKWLNNIKDNLEEMVLAVGPKDVGPTPPATRQPEQMPVQPRPKISQITTDVVDRAKSFFKSFSAKAITLARSYIGTSYDRLNCQEFVAAVLDDSGIKYVGGLVDDLIRENKNHGDGIIDKLCGPRSDQNYLQFNVTRQNLPEVLRKLQDYLSGVGVFSLNATHPSRGSVGHTGFFTDSNTTIHSGGWTTDRRLKNYDGVHEEPIQKLLAEWVRIMRPGTIRLRIGRLDNHERISKYADPRLKKLMDS